MKEGDLVMVVGNLDNRVRDNESEDARVGTLVSVTKDEAVVLLSDMILWKGPKREVVLHVEESTEEEQEDCEL